MRTLIKRVLLRDEPCDEIHIAGWVRTRRDSKAFSFLEINDGTCLANLQVVADAGIPGSDELAAMNTGDTTQAGILVTPGEAVIQLYRLANIKRTEPAADLFKVPEEYKSNKSKEKARG